MFGSSKNGNPQANGQPGFEKLGPAKQPDPLIDDIPADIRPELPPELQQALAERKAQVARAGFSFPAKPKPQASAIAMPVDGAAHLIIGKDIKLRGELEGCDLMRVEGTFEGITRTRALVLCSGSSYLGTAEVDEAEIEGVFEGNLHVRGRLWLRSKGRIRGTFSYGQLEIERGGELEGRIGPFAKNSPAQKAVSATSPLPAGVQMPKAAVRPVAPANGAALKGVVINGAARNGAANGTEPVSVPA